MDIEYVNARLFLNAQHRFTSSHAIFDYLRRAEEGAAGSPEAEGAVLPPTIEESRALALLASNVRVAEWLAQIDTAKEDGSPPCKVGCLQKVTSCPFRACP
jgi:hypothetical protein